MRWSSRHKNHKKKAGHKRRSSNKRNLIIFAAVFAMIGGLFFIISFAAPATYKQTDFSTDPNWKSFGNRLTSPDCTDRIYNFGWSNTNFAGTSAGEIGGKLERSTQYRAYYAKAIPTKTFNDSLSASGWIRIPQSSNGSFQIGYFNSDTTYDWRANNFIGIRIGGQGGTSKLIEEYATKNGLSNGIKDASVAMHPEQKYWWSVVYTPTATAEFPNGHVTFQTGSLDANGNLVKLAPVDDAVTQQQRDDGMNFNRFGLLSNMNDGPVMTGYVDDVTLDGTLYNFNSDPGWDGSNNRTSGLNDCWIHGRQSFGWNSQTKDVGGVIWRTTDTIAYYADETSTLTLGNTLYASGTLTVPHASSDADFYIGWFNKDSKAPQGNGPDRFIGIHIGGNTRDGVREFPEFRGTNAKKNLDSSLAPFAKVGTQQFWICYQPTISGTSDGKLVFGIESGQTVSIPVSAAAKAEAGVSFNLFGIRDNENGGAHNAINFYLDNLRYTVAAGDSGPAARCSAAAISGDTNGDGHVNGLDLSIVLTHYGRSGSAGDVNHDGRVDGGDISVVLTNFGR